MNRYRFWLLMLAFAMLGEFISTPSFAQEVEHHAEYHRNVFAFFVGRTSKERRESGLALGIEYERRLSEKFGIGVLAEHTFGDVDATVYAVPFAYHTGPWKFYAAPGIEDGDLGTESLIRIGAEYGFEVNGWEVSPQIDFDLVDGERTFVFGVTFGKGI